MTTLSHRKIRTRMTDRCVLVISASLVMTSTFAAVPGKSDVSNSTPVPAESVSEKQLPANVPEITPARGQMLYENHCIACHESTAHVRNNRRANSLKELQSWVIRWSNQQQLNWSAEDIRDVVNYLNNHYYKFVPPAGGR